METNLSFVVRIANVQDFPFSAEICDEMFASAQARGTGIARRSPDMLNEKILAGKAVVAFCCETGEWAGFCYAETWSDGQFVSNSGLIVSPKFRKYGLAKRIKEKIFELCRNKFPQAKIFGLTTGLAVMKINSDLGFEPVTYSEISQDETFWAGCQSCVNFDILKLKGRKNCLCTAMLYDPELKEQQHQTDLVGMVRHQEQTERLKAHFCNLRKAKKAVELRQSQRRQTYP
jgi:hypothetical protein